MIRYQDLAFPEADRLDRALPVRLPLGAEVEAPVILPPVPYGYPGHPMALRPCAPLLESVLACLREDGFTDVDLVEGPAPWPQPPDDASSHVALVPVGHTEQHGFHLPLSTDTVIAEALAVEVERLLPDRVWRLPAWPYGVSTHRRQFPGTLSADPRLWEDLWVDLCGCLRDLGFRCVYFLNGHGGNHSFLVNSVKFAGERFPDMFVATSFLHTSSGAAADLVYRLRASSVMGHACELETSYMLHLRPDLVHLERAVDEEEFVATPRHAMDWCDGGPLVANPPWSDDTRTGTYGAPSQATAEKGRLWMAAAALELSQHVLEVLEQRRRRQERRDNGWEEGAWRGLWKPTPPA